MVKRKTIFDAFNQEFEKQLPHSKTYLEAFNKADAVFEEKIGCSVYSNYESFRTLRSNRRNRNVK